MPHDHRGKKNPFFGRKHSEGALQKMSETAKARRGKRTHSEETKRRIRHTNLLTWARKMELDVTGMTDAEIESVLREQRNARRRKGGWSEEKRAAQADRMKHRWEDHAFRLKMDAVKRAMRHTEKFKGQVAERNRRRFFFHSEETKERLSKRMTERWALSTFKYVGYVDTKKGGRCGYRSFWEKRAMHILDADELVESFSFEPFGVPYRWEGRRRWTLPDFLAKKTDGSVLMIEVKPRGFGYGGKVRAKAEACRVYCEERGWIFETWDERSLWPGLSQSEVREAVRRLT